MDRSRPSRGRRRFLGTLIAAPFVGWLGPRLGWWNEHALAAELQAAAARGQAPPTPECGDDDEPTPSATAGPFFKPRSPRRASLVEPGSAGERMVVSGRVFGPDCRPVAGALLDFWHADADGEYDLEGFRMRGHQLADRQGRYRLETIVPGVYGGRTRHFHVRVQAPRGRILTTQLYFPGESSNADDGLFRPELLMSMSGRNATFHFVLRG